MGLFDLIEDVVEVVSDCAESTFDFVCDRVEDTVDFACENKGTILGVSAVVLTGGLAAGPALMTTMAVGAAASTLTWVTAGGLIVGASKLILDVLNDEAEHEKRRWEEKREEVQQEIDQCNKNLNQHIKKVGESLDFKLMAQNFEAAKRTQQEAGRLLEDAKKVLVAVNGAIFNSEKEQARCMAQLDETQNSEDRSTLSEELESLIQLKIDLVSQRDELRAQKRRFYGKARYLSQKTEQLALQIRDNAGIQGKEWFKQIESSPKNSHE